MIHIRNYEADNDRNAMLNNLLSLIEIPTTFDDNTVRKLAFDEPSHFKSTMERVKKAMSKHRTPQRLQYIVGTTYADCPDQYVLELQLIQCEFNSNPQYDEMYTACVQKYKLQKVLHCIMSMMENVYNDITKVLDNKVGSLSVSFQVSTPCTVDQNGVYTSKGAATTLCRYFLNTRRIFSLLLILFFMLRSYITGDLTRLIRQILYELKTYCT